MKLASLCLGLCGAGVLLIGAGLLWSNGIGDKTLWSEEQAIAFNQASAAYHQAAHAHAEHDAHHGHIHLASSQGTSMSDAELAAAKSAWQEQMRARDAAIAWRDGCKRALIGGGMLLGALGGIGYLVIQRAQD
jgi:hypothetical protein